MRAIPSGVLGPVLRPPCSRQRPFGIAGHMQGVPRRFLAPQRAAFEKSPEGLPFLSIPRRFSWGVSLIFSVIPHPPARSSCCHCANDGLAAIMDMDVLHCDLLLA